MLSVYADGSSTGGTRGAVGWAWLITDHQVIVASGYGGTTNGTNNTAELQAAIDGLTKALESNLHVNNQIELVCDSQYVLGTASGTYNAVKNLELTQKLRQLAIQTNATFRWVRGHSGDKMNEAVDFLAKKGRNEYSTKKATHEENQQ
jgi:ribonuclease HI